MIAVVLILAAFKMARPVVLPLVVALLMLALTWPYRRWLGRWCSPSLASGITFVSALVFLCILLIFIYLMLQRIVGAQDQYVPALTSLIRSASSWLDANGLPRLGNWFEDQSVRALLTTLMANFYQFFAMLLFVFVLFLLAMPAMEDFQQMLAGSSNANGADVFSSLQKSASSVQAYVVVTTGTSAVTGVLTGLLCWSLGIDLALVWGGFAFLLNYIPTIGSIIALVPPVLMSILQYDGSTMPLLTLGLLGCVQLIMGNYVHPKLAGRQASLRPVVILFSLTLWGFIWGPVGALIAVPIMTTVAIFAANHKSTRWLALILSQRVGPAESES